LSDAEIADVCTPLVQPAAQVRYLRSIGLEVKLKPNGRPLVARSHFEEVLSQPQPAAPAEPGTPARSSHRSASTPARATPGPDRQALTDLFSKGQRHGSKAHAQPA
jgi:hypothetical protein